MYADDLPEQAVMAIRAATRLSNKELAETLAATVQETEEVEMEVP
jgi:DNA-binding transcriptional regulator YiaG